jgi:hypothetical protein
LFLEGFGGRPGTVKVSVTVTSKRLNKTACVWELKSLALLLAQFPEVSFYFWVFFFLRHLRKELEGLAGVEGRKDTGASTEE